METDLIRALHRRWDEAGPDEAATARARAAAIAATPSVAAQTVPARRRFARSPRRVLAVSLATLVVGAGAALAVTQPWDRDSAPQVPATRSAAELIVADPLLSQLAWINGARSSDGGPARIQELPDAPSLRFPPGVSFEDAFQRIMSSLATSGALPAEATLGEPLPLGKTLALAAQPGQGIAIDLRSPRGYLLPGGILPSGFAAAPDWSPAEAEQRVAEAGAQGLIVPLGAVIQTPDLEPCQILDPANPTPACDLPGGGG